MDLNASAAAAPVIEYPTSMDQVMTSLTNYGLTLINYVGTGITFLIAFIVGYLLGCMVSKVLQRLLMVGELQKNLVRYGAVTTKMWESVVNFITHYVLWLTVVFVIHTVFVQPAGVSAAGEPIYTSPLIDSLFQFMVNLLALILFAVIGLLVGGVLYKVIKDALEAIGLETELERLKIVESFGGISLSSILAGIVKWYIVLLFLTTGVQQLLATIQIGENTLFLEEFMEALMAYIPNAILGILVILASLILADIAAKRIRYSTPSFSQPIALVSEMVIIFFGIVLALPRLFNVNDPEVFKTSLGLLIISFELLVAGVSLGLAIAIGLGLKDVIAKAGREYGGDIKKEPGFP